MCDHTGFLVFGTLVVLLNLLFWKLTTGSIQRANQRTIRNTQRLNALERFLNYDGEFD